MNIYEKIWNADENGCQVSSLDTNGSPINADAEIILNEQSKSSGRRHLDLATQPLFHFVNTDILKTDTYAAFIKLLDNYAINTKDPEVVTPVEDEEIDKFLKLIIDTRPMQLAYSYVIDTLGFNITEAQFVSEIRTMWFEIYTNHYNGRSTHYCSGFEHVFVGEGKYSPREGAAETKGNISGYHSWVKFYLDELYGRVNYLGYKYDLGGQGPDQPVVVTLQMVWNHQSLDGSLVAELFKKKGGFFVGRSPECEIALGSVAMFESLSGLVSGDRIPASFNQGKFNLVLYRNITEQGKRGNYIRSFYPEYLGSTEIPSRVDIVDTAPNNRTTVIPINRETMNAGHLRIFRALPNPVGSDTTGEWVEVKNHTAKAIDLTGFELRDKMSRPWRLTGEIAPHESLKIEIDRHIPNGFQLGNNGGLITIHHGAELIAAVVYPKSKQGKIFSFESNGGSTTL